ncbi:MAG: hypothetical protein E7466_08040 [Ruminococcaceae bacterium]|nr:hypothetical protein [Oscillospiraceae bacterium]
MKNNTKTQNIEPMDERQRQITGTAIVYGYLFLVLCLIASTVYRIVTTGEAGWELFALVGSCLVIIIARRMLGDVEQPLDHKNRPLPLGDSKADKRVRRKSYAFGSVLFGAAFAVMDIILLGFGETELTDYELTQAIFPKLNKGLTVAITAIIAFVTMFLVSYIFDYLVGEWRVKRYNKMIAQLDSEED